MVAAPKATTFWSRLSVTSSVSGQRYQVLKPGPSDNLYRARYLWSVYIIGSVDPRDATAGIAAIRTATKAYNSGTDVLFDQLWSFVFYMSVIREAPW